MMDPLAKQQFEERIVKEVQTLLAEGDITYLRGLSRPALLEALEAELRFLGLYAYHDHEKPAVIHRFLEERLDQWCEDYLWQRGALTSNEQEPAHEAKIQTAVSSLIQTFSSTGTGEQKTEATHYIGFMPHIESPCIQVSPVQ